MAKSKYIVVFLKKVDNTYTYRGKKKVSPDITEIHFKNKVIPDFNKLEYTTYMKKNIRYYFVDIDKGFINFNENNIEIDLELVSTFIEKKIITNTLNNLAFGNMSKKLMDLIIGAIMGVLLGLLIGMFI